MRFLLICAGLIAALILIAIGIDLDLYGRYGAGRRPDMKLTENPAHLALASLGDMPKEAAAAAPERSAPTSEALARVPVEDVCATLVAAADASGLPALFFLRLIWQESRFEQHAVSAAGALGVAQFMPEVAAERGLERPFEPLTSLWASAFFLRDHYRTFGNIGLAAMAYNAGAKRVLDWLAQRGKLPEETRKYVTIITGHPPEKWTETKPLDLALTIPRRAPCGNVAGLSQRAGVMRVDVQLQTPIRKIVETAKAARKAKEAKAARDKKIKEARAPAAKAKKAKDKDAKATAEPAKAPAKTSIMEARVKAAKPKQVKDKDAAPAATRANAAGKSIDKDAPAAKS